MRDSPRCTRKTTAVLLVALLGVFATSSALIFGIPVIHTSFDYTPVRIDIDLLDMLTGDISPTGLPSKFQASPQLSIDPVGFIGKPLVIAVVARNQSAVNATLDTWEKHGLCDASA